MASGSANVIKVVGVATCADCKDLRSSEDVGKCHSCSMTFCSDTACICNLVYDDNRSAEEPNAPYRAGNLICVSCFGASVRGMSRAEYDMAMFEFTQTDQRQYPLDGYYNNVRYYNDHGSLDAINHECIECNSLCQSVSSISRSVDKSSLWRRWYERPLVYNRRCCDCRLGTEWMDELVDGNEVDYIIPDRVAERLCIQCFESAAITLAALMEDRRSVSDESNDDDEELTEPSNDGSDSDRQDGCTDFESGSDASNTDNDELLRMKGGLRESMHSNGFIVIPDVPCDEGGVIACNLPHDTTSSGIWQCIDVSNPEYLTPKPYLPLLGSWAKNTDSSTSYYNQTGPLVDDIGERKSKRVRTH